MAEVTKVTVDVTPTQIIPANGMRKSMMIRNNGTASIFVGKDNQVTIVTGLELPQGVQLNVDADTAAYWGIAAVGTQACDVVEVLL